MNGISQILVLALLVVNGLCENEDEKSHSTSVAGMQALLGIERTLIQALQGYAIELNEKLDIINRAIEDMTKENNKSVPNAEEYLSNPLNAYSLIRRMQSDWVYWELFMQKPVAQVKVEVIRQQRPNMPTSNDLVEATSAIYRLQSTYNLAPIDIAGGLLNGKQYEAKLSSIDCFTIGNELINQDNTYRASFWLYNSILNYDDNPTYAALEFDKLKALELYADTMRSLGRVSDAIKVVDTGLVIDPHHARFLKRRQQLDQDQKLKSIELVMGYNYHNGSYEKGCRGEFANRTTKLHCRYNTTTTAFLKLAPIKMEEISLDPYVVVFHDIITDEEIDILKALAIPQLKRATVYNEERQGSLVVNRRTSKFAWFYDNLNGITTRINKRIADMTGFDLVGSEMLQVMNYGLGGHYDTHYDFFNLSTSHELVRMQGDRISTVLIYLTDVEQGGATVFPNIGISVLPQKGSALVWYNLNNRGQGDWRTLHAACPVIVGSKWVCNKWVREKAQTFRRPCYKE